LAEEKESVLRIKTIIDSMLEGVVVVDTGMHFTLFNKSAERILGVGLSQKDPSKWEKIYGVYLPDQKTLLPVDQFPLKKALKGEIVTGFLQYVKNNQRKDGLYLSTTAAPLRDLNGRITGAVAVLRDVSKEKEIDEAKTKQLAVTAKEKESVRLKLEVTAKKLARTAKEKESVRRKLVVTAKTKESVRLKLEVTAEELKESRKTLEKKVLERTKDLEQIKAKDEAILVSIGDGLVVVDAKGEVLMTNKAFGELLGWKNEEVVGRLMTEVAPREDEEGKRVPFNERILSQVLAGKNVTTTTTTTTTVVIPVFYYVRKDQTRFPASSIVTPFAIDGKIIGAIEIFRDITKEKEIDKAKTEFVSLASHQLRTPLSTVNWYAEMLLAGDAGKLNEGQKKYLDEVYRSSQRMVELVNALLNVSRIELGTFVIEPKPTDIVKLTRSVIDEQKPQIDEKKIKFSSSFEKDIPLIQSDPKLLHMVMQNLLSNAVKYTSEGGKIELAISLVDKKNIQVKISDTGYGIPKNQQDKIFTKLFRTDNVREKDTEGTGLGLYIVKSIVEHSGGKIWFESEENKGTIFYVTLPLEGIKKKEGDKALS